MNLKAWLQVGRAQTIPATSLLLLVPYLTGGHASLIGALLMTVFGILVHLFSFGQNSLLDTTVIHYRGRQPPDLGDPAKAHHPLVSGVIELSKAHSVINWGLALLATGAGIWSLFGSNPALSMFSLIVWFIWGWGYNAGLSKVSVIAFLPISICFTGLTGWAWFLTHETIGWTGAFYFAYVFLTILFQISVEGNLKEMAQAERSNLLIKLGASLRDGWFHPGWSATSWGVGIKILSVIILALLAGAGFTIFEGMWYVLCAGGIAVLSGKLCLPHFYDRLRELKIMSLMEIVSIYSPIPFMVGWRIAVILMIAGVIWFVGVNKLLWGTSHPRV